MIKVRWEMGFERQPTELQACYGDGGSTGTFRKLNPLKALSRHFRLWIFMKNWEFEREKRQFPNPKLDGSLHSGSSKIGIIYLCK
jgi:hypothetical protein